MINHFEFRTIRSRTVSGGFSASPLEEICQA
jgi:hypothetical protein